MADVSDCAGTLVDNELGTTLSWRKEGELQGDTTECEEDNIVTLEDIVEEGEEYVNHSFKWIYQDCSFPYALLFLFSLLASSAQRLCLALHQKSNCLCCDLCIKGGIDG